MKLFDCSQTVRTTVGQPGRLAALLTGKAPWPLALVFVVISTVVLLQETQTVTFFSHLRDAGFQVSIGLLLLCAGLLMIVVRSLVQTESALRASEERFHHMAAHLPYGMIYQFLLRQDGSVSFPYVSPSCKELFALESEAIQNNAQVLIQLIHPEDRAGFEQSVAHSAATLESWHWEGRFLCTGRVQWAHCASRPRRLSNGDILWDGLLMDITAHKQVEKTLLASEKKYRTLYDSVTDGIVKANLQDQFEECNPAFLAMLGYSLDDLKGRSCTDITPARWTALEKDIVAQQVMVRGYSNEYEKEFIRKDGSLISVSIKLWLAKNEQGEPESLWGLVRDISARRQAEAALQRLALVAQKAPSAVVMTDVHGTIQWVNEAFTRITGYNPQEAMGQKPGWLLQGPETDSYTIEQIRMALQKHEPVDCEIYNYRKDGEGIWLALSITPVHDESGRVQGFIGLETNVTERKQAEEELARYANDLESAKIAQEENAAQLTLLVEELESAKHRAEEAARAKSEFLATMSHEIRTPMNGVVGMTGLLLDTELTEEQREYARTVRNSAESLMTIINDILDFSKIEAGKLELEIIDFDLRTAVEEALELFAEQAASKGIELSCLIHTDTPTALRGDPGRLRQILINLVGNALKFTTHGEVVVEVQTSRPHFLCQHGSAPERPVTPELSNSAPLYFSVRDTGIGIPADRRDRLFQSFSQVDASTTRKYGGTGLGLAICKKLTEIMGGEISVVSEPGKGSTFWFMVRLELQPPEGHETTTRTELAGLRALIVDDNKTNRQILRQHLTAWKVIPGETEDGPQALDRLRAAAAHGRPYDIVLLDFMMPVMDGMELARMIKADPAVASSKLLLLTSSGRQGDRELARKAGIDGFLTKPVRQAHLWGCLTSIMGRSPDTTASLSLMESQATTETPTCHRLPILIAEDNPVNQKLAVRLVEKLGYRADVAANGLEAVAALKRIPYAAVLMDCQMPEMDGFAATREIRLHEARLASSYAPLEEQQVSPDPLFPPHNNQYEVRRIPIIAMTANAMHGDRERCLEAGMDDYISKPIKPAVLKATLAHWAPLQEDDERTTQHAA